eukprot:8023034-Alexandrium_andersonii.AAC.1
MPASSDSPVWPVVAAHPHGRHWPVHTALPPRGPLEATRRSSPGRCRPVDTALRYRRPLEARRHPLVGHCEP